MKKTSAIILGLTLLAVSAWAAAPPHRAVGMFNGWTVNDPANELNDTGTAGDVSSGDGIYTFVFAAAATGEREIKTTGDAGWGDSETPASGNFVYEVTSLPASVTLTLDTNSASDGWVPDANRMNTDAGYSAFTVVGVTGDWVAAAGAGSDWDPATAPSLLDDGLSADSSAADGIYTQVFNIPTPGSYSWKGLLDPTVDMWSRAIAPEGFTTGGNNLSFSTTVTGEAVVLEINTNNWTSRATATGVVPVELSVFSAE